MQSRLEIILETVKKLMEEGLPETDPNYEKAESNRRNYRDTMYSVALHDRLAKEKEERAKRPLPAGYGGNRETSPKPIQQTMPREEPKQQPKHQPEQPQPKQKEQVATPVPVSLRRPPVR